MNANKTGMSKLHFWCFHLRKATVVKGFFRKIL
jgi:hypothetical protein